MNATLYRSYLPHVTLGRLVVDGVELRTVECPWLDNARNVSCIPEGVYQVEPYSSARFPNVWQLQDVPGRDYILIHAGNSVDDIEGCIAVGEALSEHEYKIHNSRRALGTLRSALPSNFTLTITTEVPPGVRGVK